MDLHYKISADRILLQFANPKNTQMIREHLSDKYEFIPYDGNDDFDSVNFDLCIVGGKSFRNLREYISKFKERISPVYLPVILLIKESRLKYFLNPNIEHVYDDLITLPVSPAILESRVDSLLKQRRHSLELSEKTFLANQAINSTEVGICITDNSQKDNPLVYINKGFEELTGYSSEEILGQNCRFLQNDDLGQEGAKKIREGVENGKHADALLRNYKKDGSLFWNEVSISPVTNANQQNEYFIGVQNDVTELIEIQNDLKDLLEEKEVLLQEIHHRIKNNLAVIIALLELKAMSSDNEETVDSLHETQTRIFSIAKVHELLYDQDQFNKIEFQDFVHDLIAHLDNVYSQKSKYLNFQFQLEHLLISLDQAVPCGMLLAELITNIYKHGFGDEEHVKVKISIRKTDDRMKVTIKDNGKGLPEGKNLENMDKFSQSIINKLLKQLNADWKSKSDNGFQFMFRFELKDYSGIISKLRNRA